MADLQDDNGLAVNSKYDAVSTEDEMADFQPVKTVFRRARASSGHRRQGFEPLAQLIRKITGMRRIVARDEPV